MSYLFNALGFLLGLACDFVVVLLLTRVIAEACRADFHNPLSQLIYRWTNPVLAPLRRVLPNWRRINLAALVLALLALALKRLLLFGLLGILPGLSGMLVLAVADLLDFLFLFYIVLVFGWALLGMFGTDPRQPLIRLLEDMVAPLMRPLRGRMTAGSLDFSPLVVLIALFLARMLITAPLLDLGTRLATAA